MTRLVIFDLDGVLLDSREIHYQTLNEALERNGFAPISREDHLSTFDGLTTTKKLAMLTEQGRVPATAHDDIWQAKQAATFGAFNDLQPDYELIEIMARLKKHGVKIACASNSIRNSVKLALLNQGLMPFIDYWVSNEDVKRPKPHPEMYWACMTALGVIPRDTVIVEDSHIGRRGALDSGANLFPVENRSSLTIEIADKLIAAFPDTTARVPWRNPKMNVLIPMAGEGSRFANAGYTFPKPLIEVRGKPMIQTVVENLNVEARFIFIVRREHYEKYHLKHMLNLIAPGCEIVLVDGLTEGAACTTLLAKSLIDSDDPLMIANSDQFIEWNSNETLYAFGADGIDAGIVTFEACFGYSTMLDTLEFGKVPIGKIVNQKIPCHVKSYNQQLNEFEYTRVTGYTKLNGNMFDWVEVSSPWHLGRKFRATSCHRFLAADGSWRTLSDLGNWSIQSSKYKLSQVQKEVLDGTMLGDGSISVARGRVNSGLKFTHSFKQKEWALRKLSVFENFVPTHRDSTTKDGYDVVSCQTAITPEMKNERKRWYDGGSKIVPDDLKLSFLTMAVWYMDDGCIINEGSPTPTARFATDGFSHNDVGRLVEKIKELGISTYVVKSGLAQRICVSASSAKAFFEGIEKYVIPEMRYKLPECYRGIGYCEAAWHDDERRFLTTRVDIAPLEANKSDTKYAFCVTTENGNFLVDELVAHNCHPKWSYARLDDNGFVAEVAEKKVISNLATVGVYYWSRGSDYVRYAEQMIAKDIRVNGEYYVAPVFNEAIADGKKVRAKNCERMWGIGTPEDLNYFLENHKE